MGFYLNHSAMPSKRKAEWLIKEFDAELALIPDKLRSAPEGKMLVCVIENDIFDAAGVAFSNREKDEFEFDGTPRRRTWLWISIDAVLEMSPFSIQAAVEAPQGTNDYEWDLNADFVEKYLSTER